LQPIPGTGTLDLTGADRGCIVYAAAEVPTVSLGEAIGEDVLAWAKTRLVAADEEDDRTAGLWDDAPITSDVTERIFHAVAHSVSVLWRGHADVQRPVAVLVLGSAMGQPSPPPAAVLRVLAEHLARARDATTLPQVSSG